MRVTSGSFFSSLVFAQLAVLVLAVSSSPAHAQTRSFQMAMWAESDQKAGIDTDIPMFFAGNKQPPGRYSILIRSVYENVITAEEYYWPLIVAVLVDEPYEDLNHLGTNCWSETDVAAVNARTAQLVVNAAQLKSVAPKTRYWVNLTQRQLDWMKSPNCSQANRKPVNVNGPHIDVISVDIYEKPFTPEIEGYYVWLAANGAKPDQQMALVPGTHFRLGQTSPSVQASYLAGFFDYANNANSSCNRPLGSRGRTGFFDGCPVWIVMGWLGYNHTDGWEYIGERDSRSEAIANVWRGRLALPLRSDLARPKAKELLPTFLPLLQE